MGVVHGVLQWLHTHLYRSLCGSSEWCMCLYISGSTPTYRGVKMGMVHGVIQWLYTHLYWVYVGMVYGVCAYIMVVHPHGPLYMWLTTTIIHHVHTHFDPLYI